MQHLPDGLQIDPLEFQELFPVEFLDGKNLGTFQGHRLGVTFEVSQHFGDVETRVFLFDENW